MVIIDRLHHQLILAAASCLLSAAVHGQSQARQIDPDPVHWAFASLVGTGWYKVEDGRSAFIAGLAPRQSLHHAELSESGERQIGLNVRYDAALGLYRLDDILEIPDADNLSTLSFTPGLEVEFPVTERWWLRTFANLGWGTALDNGLSAWIYYTGIRSRFRFDFGRGDLDLLSGAYYAGYSPDPGPSEDLTALYLGLEYRHGIKSPKWGGNPLDLIWNIGYTSLADPAEFGLRDASLKSISDAADIGFAVALRNRPFRILGFEFDRVGLTYSRGENGEFGSLVLNLSSWFNR